MSKRERSLVDDIVEIGREILEQIDGILNPEKHRKPARVPVPVRSNYPPARDPNHNDYR